MIKSFKDVKDQPQSFPDPEIRNKLQQKFPSRTQDALNKALIITNNSFDLSCSVLNSECKLDSNRFEANLHQVESDFVEIVLYSNGLTIEHEFFDYSVKRNRDIRKSIQMGEINSNLIGNDSDGYVRLIDRSSQEYTGGKKKNENKSMQGEEKNSGNNEKVKGFTIAQLKKMQKK